MGPKCKRCRTYISTFWHPFVYGYTQGEQNIKEEEVFYLCDSCLHDFACFLDIDLYMVKERIQ